MYDRHLFCLEYLETYVKKSKLFLKIYLEYILIFFLSSTIKKIRPRKNNKSFVDPTKRRLQILRELR